MIHTMVSEPLPASEPTAGDQVVVLHGATWEDYQRVMEIRGEGAVPRIAFLEGELEIVSPGRNHETIKSRLGSLVETYCLERGIEFESVGSWTLQDKKVARGVEPDECWIFGVGREVDRPDLAIEVAWSSGGIRKLEIYQKLGVREVWYGRRGRLTPYVLVGESYDERTVSEVLAGIDLRLLTSFLDAPTASAAIRGYRDALR
jgi:Uma2 family endonuclease